MIGSGLVDIESLAGHRIPAEMLFGVCPQPRSVILPHRLVAQDLLYPVGKFHRIVTADPDAQITDMIGNACQPRGDDWQSVGRGDASR